MATQGGSQGWRKYLDFHEFHELQWKCRVAPPLPLWHEFGGVPTGKLLVPAVTAGDGWNQCFLGGREMQPAQIQSVGIQRNSKEFQGIQRDSWQQGFQGIPRNPKGSKGIQWDPRYWLRPVLAASCIIWNSKEFKGIQRNSKESKGFQRDPNAAGPNTVGRDTIPFK